LITKVDPFNLDAGLQRCLQRLPHIDLPHPGGSASHTQLLCGSLQAVDYTRCPPAAGERVRSEDVAREKKGPAQIVRQIRPSGAKEAAADYLGIVEIAIRCQEISLEPVFWMWTAKAANSNIALIYCINYNFE
jgi:hypothetical protein